MKNLRYNLRSKRGVVMATADLLIMIPMVVGGAIFLADSGLSSCYKQKLSFILNQAANYAANLPPDEEPTKVTKDMVAELCKKSDLASTDLKVTVQKTTIGDEEAISVAAVANFPLLKGSFLPLSITMKDTAVALIPANRVCAAISISPYPYSYESPEKNISVYVPIIQPRHRMPVWQFPYDTAINNLHLVDGPPPTTALHPSPNYLNRPSLY